MTILDSFASIYDEERVWKFDGGREVFVSYGPAGEFENQLTPDVRAAFTHEEDDPGYLFTGLPTLIAVMLIGS